MSIETMRTGMTVRFQLRGAVALGNGEGSLRRAVERALREGARRIEVDAGHVKYLDAAGLGALVACRRMAREAGADFILSGVVGKPLELLRLTGLDRDLLPGAARGSHPLARRIVA